MEFLALQIHLARHQVLEEYVELFAVLELSTDRFLRVVELGDGHGLEIAELRKRLAIVPQLHLNLKASDKSFS